MCQLLAFVSFLVTANASSFSCQNTSSSGKFQSTKPFSNSFLIRVQKYFLRVQHLRIFADRMSHLARRSFFVEIRAVHQIFRDVFKLFEVALLSCFFPKLFPKMSEASFKQDSALLYHSLIPIRCWQTCRICNQSHATLVIILKLVPKSYFAVRFYVRVQDLYKKKKSPVL